MKRLSVLALAFSLVTLSSSATEQLLLDATFENAELFGWKVSGDLCVAPSFCAGNPSGKYWVALSTNNEEDPITMCGSSSTEGLTTLLRSPNLVFHGRPSRIRVDFKIKFLTNENTTTDLGNDSLIVRLLTAGGPVVLAAFDDSGASPESKNLVMRGNSNFRESSCNSNWKWETELLEVTYYRSFRDPFRSRMAEGPIAIEFSLSNHFDKNFDSAVVIDDLQVRVDD